MITIGRRNRFTLVLCTVSAGRPNGMGAVSKKTTTPDNVEGSKCLPRAAMKVSKRGKFVAGVLFAALLSALPGCAHASAEQLTTPELIVLPGATEVHQSHENEGTVSYQLSAPYPADDVIRTIRERLEESGWRSLPAYFVDPSIPNSTVRGWTEFEISGKTGEQHQWMGQWEDATGRLVWYVLEYDAVAFASPKGPVRVRATLLSAERVRAIQAATKQLEPAIR